MRVLLVQIDGKMPNLALMKASSYHKQRGDEVGFHLYNPHLIYVSVIFPKNFPQAKGIQTWYPSSDVFIGGPGAGGGNINEPMNIITRGRKDVNIEMLMPDYELYGIDYSMGFTSRGCIRKCPFCAVHDLEGGIREATPIENFHHPDHKKIILFDNNLLSAPNWHHTMDYILEHDLKVNFSQGLDIRLVDEEVAECLKQIKAYNWHFKYRALHFAWDLMEGEKDVIRGISTLMEAGISKKYLMFFMLVGFNTTHQEDLHRFKVLTDLGVDPYVMPYNGILTDPFIKHLKRWVNRRVYKKSPKFEDYYLLPKSVKNEVKQLRALEPLL